MVYGSRFTGTPRRVLYFWHHVANKVLTLVSNMVTNLNLTDMETGYKVFRADIIKSITIRSNRFGVEPELTAKLARVHARIYEVPISYAGRAYWEGKKIRWTDGVVALWTILRYAFVDDQENADPGYKTLLRLSRAERYNRWMLEQLSPWLGQRVLEIGSGIGNFTRYLVGRELVLATDAQSPISPHPRKHVRAPHPGRGGTARPHAFDPAPFAAKGIDTIVCLNVLEHVEDDREALRRLHAALVPGGRLLLLVPAHAAALRRDRPRDRPPPPLRPDGASIASDGGRLPRRALGLLQPDGRPRLVPEQRPPAAHDGSRPSSSTCRTSWCPCSGPRRPCPCPSGCRSSPWLAETDTLPGGPTRLGATVSNQDSADPALGRLPESGAWGVYSPV